MYLLNGHCYYSCLAGYYMENTSYNCIACHESCHSCFASGNTKCNKCGIGYVLDNTTCTVQCSNGLNQNKWGICFEYQLINQLISILIICLLLLNW
jgi:proprotein convertase subtilisin/kexin type 5